MRIAISNFSDQNDVGIELEQLLPGFCTRILDGKTLREPLIMRGRTGRAIIKLEDEPFRVSLNDDFEAIVRLED